MMGIKMSDFCVCGNINGSHHLDCKKIMYKRYNIQLSKERRKKLIKNHLCLTCGKKTNIIRCPHCNKIIKYNVRCKSCLSKIRKRIKNKEQVDDGI